jgi:large subunit ribosomal protein L19
MTFLSEFAELSLVTHPNMIGLSRSASRLMSTALKDTIPTVSLFKNSTDTSCTPAVPPPKPLRQGKGLMHYLKTSLPTPEKQAMLRELFSRHSQ